MSKASMIATVTLKVGLNRDLNPGPPAPKAGIIPLDQAPQTRGPRAA